MSPLATYIAETLVTLLAVVVLAVLLLVTARRVGLGRPAGPLELVGRLPLDGRRAVYLVRVADAVFVLGASEAGLSKLGEVPGAALRGVAPELRRESFGDALARVLGRNRPATSGSKDGQDAR